MWDDIQDIYASAASFALALPLLFIIPAIPEFAQHVVEARLGMYDSIAVFRSMSHDPSRLVWGYAKTLALLLPSYWLIRYVAFGRDTRRAAAIEWPAAGLWSVLFVISGALQADSLFGPSLNAVLGLTGRAATIMSVVTAVIASVIGVYWTCWQAAWPLGNARCGPLTSIRLMVGSFWRTIVYMIAGILPLMVVHYAVGFGAIGRPGWLMWPMLAVDALLVAMLAHTMSAVTIVAARHAARRHGYSLLPTADAGRGAT